jgi:hypothetical protein
MIKFFLTTLFFISIITSTVFSQFQNFQKFPHTEDPYSYENHLLLTAANNNLILIFLEYDDLKISISEDGGNNWNSPQIIKSGLLETDEYFDLDGIVTPSGKIMVVYKSGFPAYHIAIYSENNGVTWGSEQYMPFGSSVFNRNYASALSISLIHNSAIWCTYERSGVIHSMISLDDCETWGEELMNINLNTPAKISFPIIQELSDGNLILTYLDDTIGNYGLFGRTSADSGQTWSEHYSILNYGSGIVRQKAVKESGGTITLALQSTIPLPNPQYENSDIIFISSIDGENWSTAERLTENLSYDGNQSITIFNNRLLVSFSSKRENPNDQIWFGEIGVSSEETIPPIILDAEHILQAGNTVIFSAAVFDDNLLQTNLVYNLNNSAPDSLQMFDDGTNGDLTAGDYIYTTQLNSLASLDKVDYFISAADTESNYTKTNPVTFYIQLGNGSSIELIDINNIKMPMNNRGVLADVDLGSGAGGKYDNETFMFSAGFFLSGYANNELWGNGVLSASRIEDYQPGLVGSSPDAPQNRIIKVHSTDQHFGSSWQEWKVAVSQGANYYDGNSDGVYNPVDLNSNGIWDSSEDRPDLLGDATYFCVFNDGVPKAVRRFSIDPLGIQIGQTIYVSSGADNSYLSDIIFIRYKIENTGLFFNKLESVYFGIAQDPDLGDHVDDLVGSDIDLQSSYCYNRTPDAIYGINAPASFVSLLQGPAVYIPGETFIDNNSDGIYSAGIDTPLDTAKNHTGPYIGTEYFEGAKNEGLHSLTQFMQSHPTHGDPDTHYELYNYLLGGRGKNGDSVYVSTWEFGNGSSLSDTSNIDTRFMYSGDPVTDTGWLNDVPIDQRSVTTTGPFDLNEGEPVEIICAYIVGRGSTSLNSITVAKEINQYAQILYQNNFTDLITEIKENNLSDYSFELAQNYPNPFNPTTTIKYQIPINVKGQMVNVKIIVFDILGREITTLVNEQKPAGTYQVQFDASSVSRRISSGVYFYSLQYGEFRETKKLMLLK